MQTLVPVYEGSFGGQQAERLLWRAGFGCRKGEAEALAAKGLTAAVRSLTRPADTETLVGPEPSDRLGNPLAPKDASGHDHAWWLDKMARTSRPLVERMTLVWHDWFATSNAGVAQQGLMIDQNELLRRFALGSFKGLVHEITRDPAMLLWLNGNRNEARAPNENYARELMELFTLGADRGAYAEQDVREQARALTGWRNDVVRSVGPVNFRYDPNRHDDGVKTVFGKAGRWTWEDAGRLAVENPKHPSFLVAKLWSYFVPVPPDAATERTLELIYVQSRSRVRPLLEAILRHPLLYEGPRLVKPPIVHAAGMLRAVGAGLVNGEVWAGLGQAAGQRLFYPPDVAGWDDSRWLDSATFRGRWQLAAQVLTPLALNPNAPPAEQPSDAAPLLDRAHAFWGRPALTRETTAALRAWAAKALADATTPAARRQVPVMVENALRQLIAVSPDYLTA